MRRTLVYSLLGALLAYAAALAAIAKAFEIDWRLDR